MGRGGKRKGAGRPIGTGKFGEPTKAVRLPVSMIDQIMKFIANRGFNYPVLKQSQSAKVLTDNPRAVEKLDLADSLLTSYASTILVEVEEEGMSNAGIKPGDLLLVECDAEPQQDDVVVALVDGKTVVRWYSEKAKGVELKADAPKHSSFKFGSVEELPFCGVVKKVVRDYYA